MSSSPDIELLKTALAENYSLGSVHSLTAANHPSLEARSNSNNLSCFRVETHRGSFWLKVHRAGKDDQRIRFEDRFQLSMFESDSRLVPELIQQLNGSTQLSLFGRQWKVESFVEAPHYCWWQPTWSTSYCEAAGKALFQFHSGSSQLAQELVRNIVSCVDHSCKEAEIRTDFATSLQPLGLKGFAVCKSALAFAAKKLFYQDSVGHDDAGPSPSDENLRSVIRACSRLLDASQSVFERVAAFEQIACLPRRTSEFVLAHGDYHPGNALLCADGRLVIVDFEHAHIEHWMFDVAYGLVMFGSGASEVVSSKERRQAFLGGYATLSETSLTGSNGHLLSDYEVVACALITGWLLESLPATQTVLSRILVTWTESLSSVQPGA